jgi:cytochrome oxidase Cu insertion factor (SCO1/SenC/PrrC family)
VGTTLRSLFLSLGIWGLCSGNVHAQGELALLRAPDAHGTPLDLGKLKGQVVAVTFASRFTQKEAGPINEQLATRSQPGDTVVISVIDFEGIPRMFHGYAKGKVAQSDRPGRLEHVVDENSELRQKFDTDPRHRVDILVLDRNGTLRGHFIGKQGADDAVRLVDELRRTSL